MRSGMLNLSTRRRASMTMRLLAIVLGVVTIGGGVFGAIPVAGASAATTTRDPSFRQGRLDAPVSVFVPPTADAGDDQSVPEGSVVTLDATRSTGLEPRDPDVHDVGRLRRGRPRST